MSADPTGSVGALSVGAVSSWEDKSFDAAVAASPSTTM